VEIYVSTNVGKPQVAVFPDQLGNKLPTTGRLKLFGCVSWSTGTTVSAVNASWAVDDSLLSLDQLALTPIATTIQIMTATGGNFPSDLHM
jgi:hypothetical protein